MSTLQKAPVGLLGALNLKTLGENPGQLGPALAATFEARDLYTVDLATQFAKTGTFTLAGQNIQLILDHDVAGFGSSSGFLVRTVSLVLDTDAGDPANMLFALGYKRPQYSSTVWILQEVALNVTATQIPLAYEFVGGGLLLLPGSRLIAQCIVAPAAARNGTLLASGALLP